jgi:hypothetical protein
MDFRGLAEMLALFFFEKRFCPTPVPSPKLSHRVHRPPIREKFAHKGVRENPGLAD